MTVSEMPALRQLMDRAEYLSRLHDRGNLSENQYICLLNEGRQEHGLAPVPVPALHANRNPEALQYA